jgi:hypothetical protein
MATQLATPQAAPVQPTNVVESTTNSPSVGGPVPQKAGPAVETTTLNPAAMRLLKLKVDGQEFELPESEVISLAQQGKSANKRFQEAAATRKEAETIVNYLKNNPKEAFKRLGIDVRKFSEDTLMEILQQEQMSPEQRKAQENEHRLREYEAKEKALREQEQQAKMAELERQHAEHYDKMFVQALTESGLPRTAYTVKRMAELTMVNIKKGLNLEPSQLAKIVREDYENEIKSMFGQADGDTLMNLLGKDGVKKLSKAQLAQYKSKQTHTAVKREEPKTVEKGNDPIAAWKRMKARTRSLL